MKRRIFFWLTLFLVFSSAIFFAFSFLNLLFGDPYLETRAFYTNVNITSNGAFNLTNDSLSFGKVPFLGGATRKISFGNNYPFPIRVFILEEGNISKYLFYDESSFILEEGESKDLSFSVRAPGREEEGFYEGQVIFKILKEENK
jgi:hypothetical protein